MGMRICRQQSFFISTYSPKKLNVGAQQKSKRQNMGGNGCINQCRRPYIIPPMCWYWWWLASWQGWCGIPNVFHWNPWISIVPVWSLVCSLFVASRMFQTIILSYWMWGSNNCHCCFKLTMREPWDCHPFWLVDSITVYVPARACFLQMNSYHSYIPMIARRSPSYIRVKYWFDP